MEERAQQGLPEQPRAVPQEEAVRQAEPRPAAGPRRRWRRRRGSGNATGLEVHKAQGHQRGQRYQTPFAPGKTPLFDQLQVRHGVEPFQSFVLRTWLSSTSLPS